jgi:hypothetical protein
MTNTKGYRKGTRTLFKKDFKTNGVIPLGRYLQVYKVGSHAESCTGCASQVVLCVLAASVATFAAAQQQRAQLLGPTVAGGQDFGRLWVGDGWESERQTRLSDSLRGLPRGGVAWLRQQSRMRTPSMLPPSAVAECTTHLRAQRTRCGKVHQCGCGCSARAGAWARGGRARRQSASHHAARGRARRRRRRLRSSCFAARFSIPLGLRLGPPPLAARNSLVLHLPVGLQHCRRPTTPPTCRCCCCRDSRGPAALPPPPSRDLCGPSFLVPTTSHTGG